MAPRLCQCCQRHRDISSFADQGCCREYAGGHGLTSMSYLLYLSHFILSLSLSAIHLFSSETIIPARCPLLFQIRNHSSRPWSARSLFSRLLCLQLCHHHHHQRLIRTRWTRMRPRTLCLRHQRKISLASSLPSRKRIKNLSPGS